jgi:hypothetical protein
MRRRVCFLLVGTCPGGTAEIFAQGIVDLKLKDS